ALSSAACTQQKPVFYNPQDFVNPNRIVVKKIKQPLPKPAFLVPLGFHGYFLITGLHSKTIFNPPFLLLMSAAMALVAFLLHRSSIRQ
ncbi:MAG: hypothetical protein ACERKY_08130, partial [Anaerolineales bacterium]